MLNVDSHNNSNCKQSGFTLIELMISLVLGLIISAAVVQIYTISVKTSSVQSSGSELQDASVFGLQQLEKKVRLANLGNPITRIDGTTAKGGIVLTGANLGITTTPYTDTGYLTRRAGDAVGGTNGWTGVSNTTVNSDQLTIQYTNITGSPFSDCEGSAVEVNDIAIERYFLRPVTNDSSSGAIKDLVLACDAGRVDFAAGKIRTISGTDARNFGQAGQEFITNVDQFKILLGVQYDSGVNAGQTMYLPSSAYLSITANKPAITSVKIGLIVHGSTPVLGSDDQTSFTLLGQNNALKTDTTRQKQVRATYETTTLLRNARVVNVKTSL
ncbi:PilW family protein [Psychrobacter sp. T6-6]|uniref:PilW family protein n=1 Tax=Psychrobacter sp. T6-6 TaxID=3457452 RepID=UPI003FD63A54